MCQLLARVTYKMLSVRVDEAAAKNKKRVYDSQRVITEVLSLFILFLRGMPLNSTLLCVPCFTSTPSTLRDIHWNHCTRTKSAVNAKPALQHSFDPSGTSTSPAHEMTHATSRNCAAGRARSEPLQVKLTQTGRWETANGWEWRGAGMAVFFY